MKTIQDEYAKRCAQGNGVCPAWRDGRYPQMCACLQQNQAEDARLINKLIFVIGCFALVGFVGPLGLLWAMA
jgi:hypothetical protein